MKTLQLALFVAFALTAGVAGGIIGNQLSTPEAVQAQAVPRANRDIKIALVDLVKATRESGKYTKLKRDFQDQVDARKARMKMAMDEYEKLGAELEEMKRANKDPIDLQRKEVRVKAKQEEAKVIREFCQQWLEELSNDFQKEVLLYVHETVKDYCKRNGFDLVFQLYELEASSANKEEDAMQATRAWADTLKNMPVVYSNLTLSNGQPNEYVKDITDDIIKLVKGG